MKNVLTEMGANVKKEGDLIILSGTFQFKKEDLLEEYNTELFSIEYKAPAVNIGF
jgi:hypothetical protein